MPPAATTGPPGKPSPVQAGDPLERFSEITRAWFTGAFAAPTRALARTTGCAQNP